MTRVKFCGITRTEDAELAADLGAWAIGLIFWPGSSRRCPPEQAAAVAAAVRRRVEVAGVFVNAHLDEVAAVADTVGLTLVQLHGDEGPAYCGEVARRTGAKVIKAVRVASGADVQDLRRYHTDFHLLDTRREGRWGGTGVTWDWRLAAQHEGPPLIVSGGLTPENVGDAIAGAQPWAVDVAGGVETAPGVKDHERMRAFVEAAAAPDGAPASEAASAAMASAQRETGSAQSEAAP